jgi:hypothetical protein
LYFERHNRPAVPGIAPIYLKIIFFIFSAVLGSDRHLQNRETLPAWGEGTLFVVLDNTSGDNKNTYVIGVLAHLVDIGMFKNVDIIHHLVGHSHIDVDALIGVLSKNIKNKQIENLTDFLSHCAESINKSRLNV